MSADNQGHAMPVIIKASLCGFVASKPQLSTTKRGRTRLRFTLGQTTDPAQPQPVAYQCVVAYGALARDGADMLDRGDHIIASGFLRHRLDANNQAAPDAVFVAETIGHDMANTVYTVDRTADLWNPPTTQPVGRPSPALGL